MVSSASATQPGSGAAAVQSNADGPRKLTLLPLVGLVVGSMIGGGVFSLPGDMSERGDSLCGRQGWNIPPLVRR
jgi:hypothetical protein